MEAYLGMHSYVITFSRQLGVVPKSLGGRSKKAQRKQELEPREVGKARMGGGSLTTSL
jgi:hypothetical protein